MRSIVKWQEDYFKIGDPLLLKPMILKNIAEETGVDISTVSRVTSNKYASTPFGNILLKDLFTEGLVSDSGESVSSRVIQQALKDVIEAEDKKNPFTDHQLVTALSEKGFKIARRTVAKYREMLRIPTAQLRAIWK
jgi:RNA polymerase sigma-54 factor